MTGICNQLKGENFSGFVIEIEIEINLSSKNEELGEAEGGYAAPDYYRRREQRPLPVDHLRFPSLSLSLSRRFLFLRRIPLSLLFRDFSLLRTSPSIIHYYGEPPIIFFNWEISMCTPLKYKIMGIFPDVYPQKYKIWIKRS